MPAVTTVSTSNDPYIDGMQSGAKWAVSSLSFSFPTDGAFYGVYGTSEPVTNFEAFNATQQQAARDILSMYSAIVPLTFTEITESSAVHADLRFAMTDATAAALSYGVNTSPRGGDMWFGNTVGYYDSPAPGNYGWHTFIHEIGHSIGLKHPHEESPPFPTLPTDKDFMDWTVMSYESHAGGSANYTNETWGYASTPMTLDVKGAQYMYGAVSPSTIAITYHLNPTTGVLSVNSSALLTPGANRVFLTLPPRRTTGVITLDLSDYNDDMDIDLSPLGVNVLKTAQIAALGGGFFAGANIYIPALYGDLTDAWPNRVKVGLGDNVIVGNANTNTVVLSGNRSDYSVSGTSPIVLTDTRVASSGATASITNIEYVEFADQTVATTDFGQVYVLRLLSRSS